MRTTLAAIALLVGCDRGQPEAPPTALLAVVNGTPITEADVALRQRGDAHAGGGGELTAEQRRRLVEAIVDEELIAQRAKELGLDTDPQYRAELERLQAQVRAFQRRQLGERFARKEIEERATATEAEARAYWEEHGARVRTEVHVMQILRRGRPAIEEAERALAEGMPFEEVARAGFQVVPEGQRPWDLGFLRWNQVPEAWRGVIYTMAPGAMTGVLSGPKERYWIVKLVERREDPRATFEGSLPTVMEVVRASKIEAQRARTTSDLRAKARITYGN